MCLGGHTSLVRCWICNVSWWQMYTAEQRVTGAMSPAGSVQAHVWHPRGELGPHAACPHHTGHWAFLLCVFLVNSFSQRAELWWEPACLVISLWGLMWAQSSGLGHASADIVHDLSSIPANTGLHGLSEETLDPPENFSWHHKAHWDARDLLPFQSLSPHLRSASKSLWSVGTQSTLNETLFHYTLALVSKTVQEQSCSNLSQDFKWSVSTYTFVPLLNILLIPSPNSCIIHPSNTPYTKPFALSSPCKERVSNTQPAHWTQLGK